MVLLGHAANLAIIAAGGTDRRGLPFAGTSDVEVQADALPQAFVLTAIVIAFAITVLLLALAVTGRADDAVKAQKLRQREAAEGEPEGGGQDAHRKISFRRAS